MKRKGKTNNRRIFARKILESIFNNQKRAYCFVLQTHKPVFKFRVETGEHRRYMMTTEKKTQVEATVIHK